MSRYPIEVRDQYERPIPGASVYVYKWDADREVAGDLETLTDDLSAPLANPLTTDADGLAYFNSVDGQKLLEYHYGGKVQLREMILVGPVPVPQAVFGGLFVNASMLSIPVGMDLIGTTGYAALGVGDATYVYDAAVNAAFVTAHPRCSFISANGRGFRLEHAYGVNIDQFGAVQSPLPGAGAQIDMSAAWLAAKAYMNSRHVNGGNNYHGVPIIDWPAGHYHMGTTTVEPSDTGVVQGAGSGKDGPGGFGATMVSFALGADAGFRIPFPNTSGNIIAGVADHDAPAGLILRGFRIKGPYVPGTGMAESEAHGFVQRGIAFVDDLHITDWPGDGHVALAGTIYSRGSAVYGGNVSLSTWGRIRCEGCRWGFVHGGTDGNVTNAASLEAYLNRQGGIFNDCGAGSAKYTNDHCAGNGLPNDGHPPTRVHYLGNIFGVRYLRATQCSTNAPPATQADDANWYYIRTGFADSTQPTWVSGTTYRAGGDRLTTDTAGVDFDIPYNEGDGFNQFGQFTTVRGGTLSDRYYRGGNVERAEFDGSAIRRSKPGEANVRHIDCGYGAYVGLEFRAFNPATSINDIMAQFTLTGGYSQLTGSQGAFFLSTMPVNGAATNRLRIDTAGVWSLTGGLGYDPALRGAQTQLTSKSTAVTLNKVSGSITMHNAALAGGAIASFTLSNSFIEADDKVHVWVKSGNATPGSYRVDAEGNVVGSRAIIVENKTVGSLSEALVLGILVFKG